MRTFLNVPLLDTNRSYQIFATIVVCFRTMGSYSDQVEMLNTTMQVLKLSLMLNEFIQTYQEVFVKFW